MTPAPLRSVLACARPTPSLKVTLHRLQTGEEPSSCEVFDAGDGWWFAVLRWGPGRWLLLQLDQKAWRRRRLPAPPQERFAA